MIAGWRWLRSWGKRWALGPLNWVKTLCIGVRSEVNCVGTIVLSYPAIGRRIATALRHDKMMRSYLQLPWLCFYVILCCLVQGREESGPNIAVIGGKRWSGLGSSCRCGVRVMRLELLRVVRLGLGLWGYFRNHFLRFVLYALYVFCVRLDEIYIF